VKVFFPPLEVFLYSKLLQFGECSRVCNHVRDKAGREARCRGRMDVQPLAGNCRVGQQNWPQPGSFESENQHSTGVVRDSL
jgi:hypothetical protein